MNQFWKKLDKFWFPTVPASRLAMLRILVGLYALYYIGMRVKMLGNIARTDVHLFRPVGLVHLLSGPMSASFFEYIVLATLATGLLFVLGIKYRYVAPVFAILLLFTLCYRNSWSMIYHSSNAVVLHVLILSVVPAADAWSVDAWFRRKLGSVTGTDLWIYGWPIQLMCAATLATYFVAGVAKVTGPMGWGWASGEALRSQIAVDALRKELLSQGATQLAFLLYEHVWIFNILGVLSLVLELGAPFVLLNKRVNQFWAINAFLMHWGIYFIMGIKFRYCLSGIIFASFFDLDVFMRSVISKVTGAFHSLVAFLYPKKKEAQVVATD